MTTDAPLMTAEEFSRKLRQSCVFEVQDAYRRAISEVDARGAKIRELTTRVVELQRIADADHESIVGLRSEVERVTKERDEEQWLDWMEANHIEIEWLPNDAGVLDDAVWVLEPERFRPKTFSHSLRAALAASKALSEVTAVREYKPVGAVRGDAAIREDAGTQSSPSRSGDDASESDRSTSSVQPPREDAPSVAALRRIIGLWDSLDAVSEEEPAEPYKEQMDDAVNDARKVLEDAYREAATDPDPDYQRDMRELTDAPAAVQPPANREPPSVIPAWRLKEIRAELAALLDAYERPAPADEQEFEKALDTFGEIPSDALSGDDELARKAAARTEVMRLYRERK